MGYEILFSRLKPGNFQVVFESKDHLPKTLTLCLFLWRELNFNCAAICKGRNFPCQNVYHIQFSMQNVYQRVCHMICVIEICNIQTTSVTVVQKGRGRLLFLLTVMLIKAKLRY